jgi:hypothetical protein
MTDITTRLRGYNPPDRTTDSQRQIAVDIYEAADEIERLRANLALQQRSYEREIELEVAEERERLIAELRTLHKQQHGRHHYYLYAAAFLAGKL